MVSRRKSRKTRKKSRRHRNRATRQRGCNVEVTNRLKLKRRFMGERSPRLDVVARKRAFFQYIADLGPEQECDLSRGERKIYKMIMRKIIRAMKKICEVENDKH